MTVDSAAARFTKIYDTLREFRLSNMTFEEGDFYCLVDAMTAEGRSIDDGEEQMKELAAEIVSALDTLAAPASAADRQFCDFPKCDCSSGAMERCKHPPLPVSAAEPVKWPNGCDKTVPAALRFLAENSRPSGGESLYNSAHLYQLADEIEIMADRLTDTIDT